MSGSGNSYKASLPTQPQETNHILCVHKLCVVKLAPSKGSQSVIPYCKIPQTNQQIRPSTWLNKNITLNASTVNFLLIFSLYNHPPWWCVGLHLPKIREWPNYMGYTTFKEGKWHNAACTVSLRPLQRASFQPTMSLWYFLQFTLFRHPIAL